MRKQRSNIFFGLDWVLLILFFILIFVGWINIYSSTSTLDNNDIFNFSLGYGKQLIWIFLSLFLIFFILLLDTKFYVKFSSILYLIGIVSLLGLFVFGKTINGATSWYNFGSFSIQPTEFVKVTTALAIAKLVSDKQFDLKKISSQLKSLIILFVPMVLIMLQPDAGSTLVYLAFIFVLYREGLPAYYILIGFYLIFIFIITLYFGYIFSSIGFVSTLLLLFIYTQIFRKKFKRGVWLKITGIYAITIMYILSVNFIFNDVFEQRHRDRFNILLGKTEDIQKIGYNANQSITTIASGGLDGRGFLQGERTQGGFVPENHTDYIFSVVGEEWGFIGSVFVIMLFLMFILRIIIVAERQKNRFSRVYGYSIASIFFVQFAINIGMVIGLMPTIGIPLPFFSYGGSSLWGFTIMLFIFIRLDAERSYQW